MVRKLIEWALDNPLVVILLAVALAVVGIFSFLNVNVEAYPDPAPAIVEVFAQYPGASAEEVERQVTVPLEVTFAGMPGLKAIRSKSLYGLSDLKMSWNYGSRYTYEAGRQEVINRLATAFPAAATGRDGDDLARNRPLEKSIVMSSTVRKMPPVARSIRSMTSRRCRTGCWNANSERCRGSSTSAAGVARCGATRSSPIRTG